VDTDVQTADYVGLAMALSLAVSRSDQAARLALEAGAEWGRQAVRPVDRAADPLLARQHLVDMLGRMGFAPETDDDCGTVQLTRCPMLEAACMHPEVVCAVHLGFVRGVLDEYGVDTVDTALRPFSSPGACELTLTKPA
jgi:predicted ArsR family transcriptional regulator